MQNIPISANAGPAFLRATVMLVCVGLCACNQGGSSSPGKTTIEDVSGAGGSSSSGSGNGGSSAGSESSSSEAVSQPTLRQTLPASWDENWFASPAVYDLDGDGSAEIIAARHSVLYVWNSDGTALWHTPVGESASSASADHGSARQYASPVVGDFDGDGNAEIAIAYSNQVAVYDHNGKLLAGWPATFPGSDGEIRSLAAADLNRDGKREILAVKTGSGPVTVVWSLNGSVVAGWPQADCSGCYDFGGYNQNIGAADLTGDGRPEVISTYDTSNIGIMSGSGVQLRANTIFGNVGVSAVPMFHDLTLAIQGWGSNGNDRDEFTESSPVFGDIDGDGSLEIVLYSDHERAGVAEIEGNCLWVLKPDMTRAAGFSTPLCSGAALYTGYENNIVQVAPSPALGQLSGDDRPEIVVPSYDGNLYAYSPDGSVLWTYRFDSAGGNFVGASGAAIGDLNNDGNAEVVFNTYSTATNVSHLIVLDAEGKLLHKISISGRGSMSVPTLADVDGDGVLEIVLSLKDTLGSGAGGVQIWDVKSAQKNYLPWPTARGNDFRTGEGAG